MIEFLGTLAAIVGLACMFIGLWWSMCDRRSATAAMLMLIGLVCLIPEAMAQDGGRHPPEHQALHNQFYRTWMAPHNRTISCCHEEDCKPAEARLKNGQWQARQVGDEGEFTPVPAERVEHERDSPDGRNHLCGKRYSLGANFTVLCFLPAGGT